jgi:hypothetical protein
VFTFLYFPCSKNEVTTAASSVDVANHNKCKYNKPVYSFSLGSTNICR